MVYKIDLKLSLYEFGSLFSICYNSRLHVENKFSLLPETALLAEFGLILEKRATRWGPDDKPKRKLYSLSMPLSVALALWSNCSYYLPDNELLAKIDKVLVDKDLKPRNLQ